MNRHLTQFAENVDRSAAAYSDGSMWGSLNFTPFAETLDSSVPDYSAGSDW